MVGGGCGGTQPTRRTTFICTINTKKQTFTLNRDLFLYNEKRKKKLKSHLMSFETTNYRHINRILFFLFFAISFLFDSFKNRISYFSCKRQKSFLTAIQGLFPSARMGGEASSGWPMLSSQPGGASGGISGCGKLLLAMAMMQAISDLRHNSGELVLIRSLRIHVLRLRSTLRSSSLINGWRRSQADQRGAGMTFLSSLLSANQRIRTLSSKSYQNERENWRKENKKRN